MQAAIPCRLLLLTANWKCFLNSCIAYKASRAELPAHALFLYNTDTKHIAKYKRGFIMFSKGISPRPALATFFII